MTPPNAAQPTLVTGEQGEQLAFDWGTITWIVSGSLGSSETMTFGKVVIRADQANPIHRHPNCDEILHLLAGELDHMVGEQTVRMRPGDTLTIPRNTRHRATSIGAEDAVMIVAYSNANRETVGE